MCKFSLYSWVFLFMRIAFVDWRVLQYIFLDCSGQSDSFYLLINITRLTIKTFWTVSVNFFCIIYRRVVQGLIDKKKAQSSFFNHKFFS